MVRLGLMKTIKTRFRYILIAVLAAVLYGISVPFSKLLLEELSATFMAALLYLGAGIGMLLISLYRRLRKTKTTEAAITKKEIPRKGR